MSRGHGSRQRAVVDALVASESARREGVSLAAIRPLLPSDRSNRRRVIRSLVQRGDAELVEDDETGEPRLKLGFMASLKALWRLDPPDFGKKGDTERQWREQKRALEEAANDLKAIEAEKRRGFLLRDRQLWAEPGTDLKRHRSPGPHQTRVIAVLVAYAESPQEGLPREAVLKIASEGSGDANATRALDRLIERGTLQQSRDGTKVRLTDWRLGWLWSHAPGVVDPPLDDAKAEAVIGRPKVPVEGFDKDRGSHVSGQPHVQERDAEVAR